MIDAPTKAVAAEVSERAEDEPDSKPEAQTKAEPEETVTVSDGRRRGRRRVMKKKTVQDEEGYLGMYQSPNPTRSCADQNCSNSRRSRLGVFLRRGACAQESEGVGRAHHRKDQEGCSEGTRKHHVFLLQEMSTVIQFVAQ
jgi:DNA polymerase delta subunit 3